MVETFSKPAAELSAVLLKSRRIQSIKLWKVESLTFRVSIQAQTPTFAFAVYTYNSYIISSVSSIHPERWIKWLWTLICFLQLAIPAATVRLQANSLVLVLVSASLASPVHVNYWIHINHPLSSLHISAIVDFVFLVKWKEMVQKLFCFLFLH